MANQGRPGGRGRRHPSGSAMALIQPELTRSGQMGSEAARWIKCRRFIALVHHDELISDRRRSGLRRLHRRDIEQAFDHLRLLRTGDGVAAGNDEARNTVDAQPMRPQIVGVHRVHLLVAGKEAA